MTTTTDSRPVPDSAATPPPVFVSPVTVHPVSQRRVVASEWVKIRSLRSSWITMGLAVAALIGLAAIIGAITNNQWDKMPARRLAAFNPIDTSLAGVNFAQLAIGVLGVLFVTGEYSTGMIRATLGAVPKRLPVLWAKALVFGGITLILMELASFAAFFVGQATLGSHSTTISSSGALRAVVGVGLYLTVVGLIGVGLGFLLRSTAGGIATLFGVLLVLPGLMNLLPQSWQDHITKYLPSVAGSALYTLRPDTGTLAPWTGFAVFCLYAVIALIGAAVVLRRRDA